MTRALQTWDVAVVAPDRDTAVEIILHRRPDLRIVAVYRMETPTCWLPRDGQLDFFSWLVGLVCPRLRTWRIVARED